MSKKSHIKRVLCLFLVLTLACITSLSMVGAEEIGEYDADGLYNIHLRWNVKDNAGNVVTKINGDLLGSSYSSINNQLKKAASNWSNSNTLAKCSVDSFSNCNVVFCKSSSIFWNEIDGKGMVAVTVPTDTSGVQLTSLRMMEQSTGKIKYASIYFNPTVDTSITNNSTYCLQTAVHELGHVYGMGHISEYKAPSIMWTYTTNQTTLTSYDKNVMNSFYQK